MPTVVTIGIYGFTDGAFLEALRAADVRMLIDVRQRRGVRGREYSWANSNRLQGALAEAGIEYRHRKDLATTTELRRLQYEEDAKLGVGQRSRVELAPVVRRRYEDEVLGEVDLARLVDELAPKRLPLCCAWSEIRPRATARSSPSISRTSTASRCDTSSHHQTTPTAPACQPGPRDHPIAVLTESELGVRAGRSPARVVDGARSSSGWLAAGGPRRACGLPRRLIRISSPPAARSMS
jgi:hypothetical protein